MFIKDKTKRLCQVNDFLQLIESCEVFKIFTILLCAVERKVIGQILFLVFQSACSIKSNNYELSSLNVLKQAFFWIAESNHQGILK